MLNNDTYLLLLLSKMKMDDFYSTSDQLRMTSFKKKIRSEKHGKVATFIFHKTGKALVSTGTRLLEIA
ncbi:hypothetical protein [Spirochaeta isovalerica]|uniref:Uncharacterized protein n=1 Tax=Spirochaeta isovalerica TaxID=150 RepID=A0A841RBA1_9SPIO|nr:hypothetical protein [Spirochaeta isovalerica]MBB6479692.1 hypothetical protein [Spirochaeta isovalerica]MBN2659170.1 hypothetical protein [Spirochaetales bacterium]